MLLDAIGRRLDDKCDELVALTQALIRLPSVNPPGEAYRDCCALIGGRLAARGFVVSYVRAEGAPGDTPRYPRVNVIARREGCRPGPAVHFNGHIDVVPPGLGWTVDPFGGELRDGKVFGRGACDMKGGIAAAIVAVETLLEVCPELPGVLEVSGTADEESGGYGGVAHLAALGFFSKPRVDHVIIPEPLDVDRVCLGHRGVWWAEIETRGRIAHGSMPFLGDSAIRHMAAVLERFERDLYPRLARKVTAMPVVPDGARHSTLNLNSLHGGLDEGHAGFPSACVADSCRLVLDRRFLLEESVEEVRNEVVTLLEDLRARRPGFDYALRELWTVPPTMTAPDAPVVAALSGAIARVIGRPAAHVVSPGTYDQKHIARIGRLHDCVAYGPGILDLAHQPDEYVVVDDMLAAAKVMALAALQLITGSVA